MELKNIYYKDLPDYGFIKDVNGIDKLTRLIVDEDEIDESLFNLFHTILTDHVINKLEVGVVWSYSFENGKKLWYFEIIDTGGIEALEEFTQSDDTILSFETLEELTENKNKKTTEKVIEESPYEPYINFNFCINIWNNITNYFKGLFKRNDLKQNGVISQEELDEVTDKAIERQIEQYHSNQLNRKYKDFYDDEVIDLDLNMAEFLIPRLIRYKEIMSGYPQDFFKSEEEWINVIDTIIYSFSVIGDSLEFEPDSIEENKYKLGMKNFAKYCNLLFLIDEQYEVNNDDEDDEDDEDDD